MFNVFTGSSRLDALISFCVRDKFRTVTKNRHLARKHMMLECNLKCLSSDFGCKQTLVKVDIYPHMDKTLWSRSRSTYHYCLIHLHAKANQRTYSSGHIHTPPSRFTHFIWRNSL